MQFNFFKFFIIIFFKLSFYNFCFANEAYFDLSENEIEIKTDFNGKEVIIFGLTDPSYDTLITIKGPNQNIKVQKKERFFGLWFNTKNIIYKNLPEIFFIASSSPIEDILNLDILYKKALYFDHMLDNLVTQRNFNFNEDNKYENWNESLIKIKKDLNFYKEYKIKVVDNKLFQTRVFFPSNTLPGTYNVNIYQIKNKLILSEKNKKIVIMKTGIGNEIFNFANNQPAIYGILCIIFAVLAGLIAATAFRRL